jgi:hypothetical protein
LSKLPPAITLAVIATLLAGCTSTPADEPETRATSSSAASKSASPSAEPTVEETEEAEPEETVEPAVEPSTEPAPEPPAEPVVEASEEPAPNLEPLPAGPNDPFVPPPHGEPNPLAPVTPGIPGVPHSDPAYFQNVTVEPQHPSTQRPTTIVQQGATLTVIGSGYSAGQEIYVMLGWPNTDYNYILQPLVRADHNGAFSFPISIGTNVPRGDYVVVTTPTDAEPERREMLKRYANVLITAAPQ